MHAYTHTHEYYCGVLAHLLLITTAMHANSSKNRVESPHIASVAGLQEHRCLPSLGVMMTTHTHTHTHK